MQMCICTNMQHSNVQFYHTSATACMEVEIHGPYRGHMFLLLQAPWRLWHLKCLCADTPQNMQIIYNQGNVQTCKYANELLYKCATQHKLLVYAQTCNITKHAVTQHM